MKNKMQININSLLFPVIEKISNYHKVTFERAVEMSLLRYSDLIDRWEERAEAEEAKKEKQKDEEIIDLDVDLNLVPVKTKRKRKTLLDYKAPGIEDLK